MTWKPTEAMVGIAAEEYRLLTGSPEQFPSREDWIAEASCMLIAVQPLIAAEARAKALEEAAVLMIGVCDCGWDFESAIRSLIPKPPDLA